MGVKKASTSKKSKGPKKKSEVKKPPKEQFNPRILAFACNWCSYAGADLAGVSRFQYNPCVRIIRVMCSGRIDPGLILTAFEKGMDGVLVSGCHPGDCHYISGNEKAEKTIEQTRELLHVLGVDEKRLKLQWISAAEGHKFAESINEFVENIRNIGKSSIKPHMG